MLKRKHHCRACGNVVCDQHSSGRVVLLNVHKTDKQRVCDKCLIDKNNEQTTTAQSPIKSTPTSTLAGTATVQSPIKVDATNVSNPLNSPKAATSLVPPAINSPAPSAPPVIAAKPTPPPVAAPKPAPKPAENSRFSMKFFSRPLSMPFSPPPPVPYAWPTQVQPPPPLPVVQEVSPTPVVQEPIPPLPVIQEQLVTSNAQPLLEPISEVDTESNAEILMPGSELEKATFEIPNKRTEETKIVTPDNPPRPKLGALLGEIENGTKLNESSSKPKIGSLLGEIRSGTKLNNVESNQTRPKMGSLLGDIQNGASLKRSASSNVAESASKPQRNPMGAPKPDFLNDIKQGGSKLKAAAPIAAAAPKQPTGLLGMLAMKMQERREFVNKAGESDDESERYGFSDSDSD